MGHRALVVYERPDETYNLHYTHWGGCNLRLKHEITPETPFGGDTKNDSQIQRVYESLQHADDSGRPNFDQQPTADPAVELEPRAVAITLEEAITEHLDYQMHEAFYVVSLSFDVTAYRTFWLGFSSDAESVTRSPSVGHGVLCTVRWHDGKPVGDGYLRGWFDGTKRLLGERIDRGLATESQAVTRLADGVLAEADDTADHYVRRADSEYNCSP